jgi:hypothetical protein
VFAVAIRHECWRDEADVWLAARDMTPLQLFRWLGGAGTPGLWYFLVMPLAKANLPYLSMTLLHATLATCVAWLIAFRAPFSRVLKSLLVFSYYFSYEFAVVARSYVLTVLLLFLIAIVLTGPVRKPIVLGLLLLLLFNTNAHGFFIAGAISVVVAVDVARRRQLARGCVAGGLIAGVGAVLSFVQLLPPPNAHPPTPAPQWTVFADAFSQVFLPHLPAYLGFFLRHSHGMTWLAQAAFLGVRWFGALLLLSILFQMRRSPTAVAIVSLSLAALSYVFVFHWYGGERHAGLLFALLVFGMWVANSRPASWQVPSPARPLSRFFFVATLLYSCVTGMVWCYQDLRWEYSGGKSAAAFIRSHSLSVLPIAATPGPRTESVLPYLPGKRFWYVARQEYGTYVRWDRDWTSDYELSQVEILRRVRGQFPSSDHLLLLATVPLKGPRAAGYVLIYRHPRRVFDANAQDEDYFLYAPARSPAAVFRIE